MLRRDAPRIPSGERTACPPQWVASVRAPRVADYAPSRKQPKLSAGNFALPDARHKMRHQRLRDTLALNARQRLPAVKPSENLRFEAICLGRILRGHHLICQCHQFVSREPALLCLRTKQNAQHFRFLPRRELFDFLDDLISSHGK